MVSNHVQNGKSSDDCATGPCMSAYPQRDVRLWRAYGSMSLQSAVGLLRNHEFEYVGLEYHKDGHHDRQADRPLQDQAQEVSLLALEARGARSDGKVLRRDHLPQNATRGVGADGQVGAQP